MARRKKNKSEAVRKYMAEHPKATPKEVAAAVKAPAALVYNVRAQLKANKTAKKAPAAAQGGAREVVAAAQLIKACGGVEQARQALKAAAQVASALES